MVHQLSRPTPHRPTRLSHASGGSAIAPAQIAEILDITESGSQQHAHRARRRIAAAGNGTEVDPASARRIVEAFVDAASSGRTERLVALLTDDATAVSGGAGGAGGLAEKLIRYSLPERIAAVVRAGFKPSAAKRKLAGGAPSIHAAQPCSPRSTTGSWASRSWRSVTTSLQACAASLLRTDSAPHQGMAAAGTRSPADRIVVTSSPTLDLTLVRQLPSSHSARTAA
jgi:hypothetical protein